MTRFVNMILDYMVSKKVIVDEEKVRAYYKYGIEITISSIFNVVLVLLFGIITNHFIHSCFYLAEFILIRSFSGGFHAKTYVGCNVTMCISFLTLLLGYELFFKSVNILFIVLLEIFSLLVITVFAPCDNPHKKIKLEKRSGFKIKSIIATLVFGVSGILLYYDNYSLGAWFVMVSGVVSVLLIYAVIMKRKE